MTHPKYRKTPAQLFNFLLPYLFACEEISLDKFIPSMSMEKFGKARDDWKRPRAVLSFACPVERIASPYTIRSSLSPKKHVKKMCLSIYKLESGISRL
jgi:hypothetical protein